MAGDAGGLAPIGSFHGGIEGKPGAQHTGNLAEALPQFLLKIGNALGRRAGQIGIRLHHETRKGLEADFQSLTHQEPTVTETLPFILRRVSRWRPLLWIALLINYKRL